MPLLSGIVGWGTNVLALKMTFYPLEFVGIELMRFEDQPFGLFGWQGIIPTKARKMAATCTDLMTEKLINVKEVFSRLDPGKFSSAMEPGVIILMDLIINEEAERYIPKIWSNLPEAVRNECILKALEESPKFLTGFMEAVKEDIEDVFDLKTMVVEKCVEDKALLNKIFQECGTKEFIFIERSGFWFGALFGCFQALAFFFYSAGYVLPLCGFVVGWLTNFIALKIIFEPIDPISLPFGYKFQGLFLTRQDAVSEVFARVNCADILTTKAMWDSILTGPKKENFMLLLRAHTKLFIDTIVGSLKTVVMAAVGSEDFEKMKDQIASRTMAELPGVIHHSYEYTTEALVMEETIATAMKGLSSRDFEGVLHPCFQEDELKLVLVGAILGLLVGLGQLYALQGGVWGTE